MKKFLITLIVTMLTCIGAWAQEASVQLFYGNTDFTTITESSPLILDVNSSGIKIWVKPSIGNYQLRFDATGSVSVAEGGFEWNNDYQAGSNFIVTPQSNGTGKVTVTVNDYSKDVVTYELYLKVADATLATSLVAPTEAVTVAPGYSVDVPFTFAPSTAVLTCSEVSGGSDNITYTFINNVLKVTASADAVPGTDTKSFTITPKTGSVDGEGTLIEEITIPVSVVAPVALTSISLDPSTAQTIVKGSSLPVSVVYNPSDAANKNVNWSSSNSGVAYYSGGSIVANSIGTATITATPEAAGVEAATLDVTVTQPITDANVTLEGVPTTTRVGVTGAKAVVKVNGAVAGSDFGITYQSSNPNVVKVNPVGELEFVGVGNATITATLNPATSTFYTGTKQVTSANINVGAEITGTWSGSIANTTLPLGVQTPQTEGLPQVSWSDEVAGATTMYSVISDDETVVRGRFDSDPTKLVLAAFKSGSANITIKAEYGSSPWNGVANVWTPVASSTYGPIAVTVDPVEGTLTLTPDLSEGITIDISKTSGESVTTLGGSWSDGTNPNYKVTSSDETVAKAELQYGASTSVKVTPYKLGTATITVYNTWSKALNHPYSEDATVEVIKTFTVTVGNKLFATRLDAIAGQQIEKGKTETINVSFAPSTATFTVTSSNSDKITANFKSETENGVTTVDYTKLVISATNASVGDAATITITPVEGSSADPVTFNVTVIKPKLPVSDVKPKSIFYVGEEYETELVMGGGLQLGEDKDYTQVYAASNNVAKNDASKAAISLDEETGKIVALNVGTAHIQATFTPVNSAADEYDVWSNGMDIVVLPGKYSLEIDVENHNIEKSDETATTTLTTPVVKLNGVAQTYDLNKYDIEYSVAPTYPGVSIEGSTVSITSDAEIGAATIKAVLTPKGGDADNYEGFTAYTQINIEPKSTDKHGIVVTVEDGVLKINSEYAGAYGTLEGSWQAITANPTIDLSKCSGITGTGADGALTKDDVINAIQAATKIEISGPINNADMQIFSFLVGGSDTKLTDLRMGEATLTEAVTTHDETTNYVADISFIYGTEKQGPNSQLPKVNHLELPKPAAGHTILPADFVSKWLGSNGVIVKDVVIPEGWTEIGANAFDGKGVETLSLPNSLLYIRESAFLGHKMRQLFLPPNVDEIERYAFANDPSTFEDVFFSGRTAPTIVDTDAFSSATQIANNSVAKGQATADGTITRNAYKDGQNYTCMMHYPSGLTPAELATYVDPTRVYNAVPRAELEGDKSGWFGTEYAPWGANWDVVKNLKKGAYKVQASTDGKVEAAYLDPVFGTVLTWPSQQQMESTYAIAGSGYHWDGTPFNAVEMARQGIYQFVLARGDASPHHEDYIFERDYTANLWWSICVPFNMPVEDIKKVFGDDTKVVRFSKVIRDADADEKYLRLEFTNSVMNDGAYGSTGNQDGSTGILAHRPYMIKPSGDPVEGDYARMENGVLRRVYPNYDWITGALIEENVVAVDKSDASTGITYTFKGNHSELNNQGEPVYMPQYAYFLSALKDDEANHQFFFQKGEKGRFHAHTAIVFTADGAQDAEDFFTPSSGAPIFKSVFGDVEDDATDIEKVELIFGNEKFTENVKVYTINGQLVNGSNLAPGLYIKNGKKFIVK